MNTFFSLLVSTALIAASIVLKPTAAMGVTYTVTTLSDTYDGTCDADCSLRDAITAANATPIADLIMVPEGTITLTITGNREDANATGDLDITNPVVINGSLSGQTIISGAGLGDRVFHIKGSTTNWIGVTLRNLEISGVDTSDEKIGGAGLFSNYANLTLENVDILNNIARAWIGGGLFMQSSNVTLSESEIRGNSAFKGGGIFVDNDISSLTVTNSVIASNLAVDTGGEGDGGGIYINFGHVSIEASTIQNNNAAAQGGGIYSGEYSDLTFANSLVDGNMAENGAGLYLDSFTTTNLGNSTVSRNVATTFGGGLETHGYLTVNLATIVDNRNNDAHAVTGKGGGMYAGGSSTVYVENTILANNVDGHPSDANPDCYVSAGTVTSLGYNLVEARGNCTSFQTAADDLLSVDPELSPLGDHGGPTHTYGLSITSPPVDAGVPNNVPYEYDQRGEGFLRQQNGRVDIGAFEWQWNVVDLAVNTTEDLNGLCEVEPGDCSLREAITTANGLVESVVTITVPMGTYTLTRTGDDGNNDAGDLDILAPVTITGSNATTLAVISAAGVGDRVLDVFDSAGRVSLVNLVFTEGNTSTIGGGIRVYGSELNLQNVCLSGNHAGAGSEGGGLYSANQADVKLIDTGVYDNTAGYGAGIYITSGRIDLLRSEVSGNIAAGSGGGIVNIDAALSIQDSEVVANTAEDGPAGAVFQQGSGILTLENSLISENFSSVEGGGVRVAAGNATIRNSTIGKNKTRGYGGGLSISAPTTIQNTTIAFNEGNADGDSYGGAGGMFLSGSAGVLTISNSIVANNKDWSSTPVHDCMSFAGGLVGSSSYTLASSAGSCTGLGSGAGDLLGADPLLGELQDNGGLTWTYALDDGSPAIDAGDPAFLAPPVYDQRGIGYPRVAMWHLDMGAYEWLDPTTDLWVNTFTDLNGACTQEPGGCALREAISTANSLSATEVTIHVPAGTYLLTRTGIEDFNNSGDLDIRNSVVIEGLGIDGSSIISAAGVGDRVIQIIEDTPGVTLSNLTITGGNTTQNGGGILTGNTVLTLDHIYLEGNAATEYNSYGGGLDTGTDADVFIVDSHVTSNASAYAGGIRLRLGKMTILRSVIASNSASEWGGGVMNYEGDMDILFTTIQGNQAVNGSGGGLVQSSVNPVIIRDSLIDGNDAAVSGGGIIVMDGEILISNSTISRNSANIGGGVITYESISISNATIADNTATTNGGGVAIFGYSIPSLEMVDTILANNIIEGSATPSDCYVEGNGGIGFTANNLIGSAGNCGLGWGPGEILGVDPMMGPLQNNGGPTLTYALLEGSPAIDVGDIGIPNLPQYDQRGEGYERISGSNIDIGAYEFQVDRIWFFLPLIFGN